MWPGALLDRSPALAITGHRLMPHGDGDGTVGLDPDEEAEADAAIEHLFEDETA